MIHTVDDRAARRVQLRADTDALRLDGEPASMLPISAVPRLLLTPEQAAEALSVGRTTVYELMNVGRLRSVRIGRSRRVPMAALDAYVQSLSEFPGPMPETAGTV